MKISDTFYFCFPDLVSLLGGKLTEIRQKGRPQIMQEYNQLRMGWIGRDLSIPGTDVMCARDLLLVGPSIEDRSDHLCLQSNKNDRN